MEILKNISYLQYFQFHYGINISFPRSVCNYQIIDEPDSNVDRTGANATQKPASMISLNLLACSSGQCRALSQIGSSSCFYVNWVQLSLGRMILWFVFPLNGDVSKDSNLPVGLLWRPMICSV